MRDSAQSNAVVGVRVDRTSYADASGQIVRWGLAGESRYVCAANVHMVMEAYDAPRFAQILNEADLVTPDGMPLVWMLKALGAADQDRVYGPTLMLHICALAEEQGVPIGLYGATPVVVERLRLRLLDKFPALQIAYAYSPPFRPMTQDEQEKLSETIRGSGARILFVGLGCPKQEIWMNENRGRLRLCMVGVGAAFDFHAGMVSQAPSFVQRLGFEWVYRLVMEPRRLWRRYLKHNPRFVALALRQLFHARVTAQEAG